MRHSHECLILHIMTNELNVSYPKEEYITGGTLYQYLHISKESRYRRRTNDALSHNLYFAALSLVLTLPDICGRAEYPSDSVTKRYISWYNEYIGQYDRCPCDDCKEAQMPYLSGEVVYNLRNSFLHQGTPNIDSTALLLLLISFS